MNVFKLVVFFLLIFNNKVKSENYNKLLRIIDKKSLGGKCVFLHTLACLQILILC